MTDPRIGANFAFTNPNTAPAITRPYTPNVFGGTPYGLGANTFNTIVDPGLKDPYSIALNFGVQQQLPHQLILRVNYAGRLGRRLLGQADASQLLDFPDKASNQLMSAAFAAITTQVRGGATPSNLPAQPWFEHIVYPGIGAIYGYPNNTSLLADFFTSLVQNGDFADFIQALAANGLINSNVGMASQFSENTFLTNKGFSSYNGLLTTLSKNLSHGVQFDLNYTWSHSIDNTSLVANSIASSSGLGFICDATRPRECRGNSDFDITNVANADFTVELPFGRKHAFFPDAPRAVDELIGGWTVSGVPRWQSGTAFGTVSNAFVAGYAEDAPAIFNGNRSAVQAHIHKVPAGQAGGVVNLFKDFNAADAAFTGPVGLTIGSRNNLRSAHIFTFDAGLAKVFPIVDRVDLKFRFDFFNVLNHPTFNGAASDITQQTGYAFGQITGASAARVGQGSLRLEF
jgi:hypothetical protein